MKQRHGRLRLTWQAAQTHKDQRVARRAEQPHLSSDPDREPRARSGGALAVLPELPDASGWEHQIGSALLLEAGKHEPVLRTGQPP